MPLRRPGVGTLHYRVSAILVVALVVGAALLYELSTTHRSLLPPPSSNTAPLLLPTPVRHLIIIFMENHGLQDILSSGPFERYLAQEYASAADFHGMTYDSIQDYTYATSGTFSSTTTTVPQLIDRAGETWAAYMESMPTPCDASASANGLYNPNHDPFVHFAYVTSSYAYCASHVRNLSSWNDSLANGTLPNYVWITPSDQNNSFNQTPVAGDAWLRAFLSPFINSSLFSSSAVLLAYDSNAAENPPPGTTGNGVTYLALVSPYSHRYYLSTTIYDDNNILTTTEWLLNLGHTNHNDNWAFVPPMVDLFGFAPTYPVYGSVTYGGAVVAGATVGGSGYSATTDANGAFSLPLSNGTYLLSASAPGNTCSSPDSTLTVDGTGLALGFALPCA